MPNTEMKNTYNMGNLTNINLGVYFPLLSFGQSGDPSNFGLKVGGEYFIDNKDYNTSTSPPFNIMGQQSNPTIAAKGSGSPQNSKVLKLNLVCKHEFLRTAFSSVIPEMNKPFLRSAFLLDKLVKM